MINIIVAIDENNGIGFQGKLPWHLSEDLKFFKKTTLGTSVVMGRKTWEGLPIKPLPGRNNVILSRKSDFRYSTIRTMNSVTQVIDYALSGNHIFVIGGAEVYKSFLPLADRLYVTKINKIFPCDAFFPPIYPMDWAVEEESELHYDEKEDLNFKFIVYKRRK